MAAGESRLQLQFTQSQPNLNLNQIQTLAKSNPHPNPNLSKIQSSTKYKPETNTNLDQIQTSTKPEPNETKIYWCLGQPDQTKPKFIYRKKKYCCASLWLDPRLGKETNSAKCIGWMIYSTCWTEAMFWRQGKIL